MKRLRSKEPQDSESFHYAVPKSYIKNKNTVNELKSLCDFYGIEYTNQWVKRDFVKELDEYGKEHNLRRTDLRWSVPNGGKIKLSEDWLEVAKDVLKSGINAYAMSKQEIHRLIMNEIEERHEKGEISDYIYNKLDISYRTFMSYINNEKGYKGLDEKSASLLEQLQDLMEIQETVQKAELFKKMVAGDTKGRQRYWELISTKDDNWNKTKKVDQKLDAEVEMENILWDIMDNKDVFDDKDDLSDALDSE